MFFGFLSCCAITRTSWEDTSKSWEDCNYKLLWYHMVQMAPGCIWHPHILSKINRMHHNVYLHVLANCWLIWRYLHIFLPHNFHICISLADLASTTIAASKKSPTSGTSEYGCHHGCPCELPAFSAIHGIWEIPGKMSSFRDLSSKKTRRDALRNSESSKFCQSAV